MEKGMYKLSKVVRTIVVVVLVVWLVPWLYNFMTYNPVRSPFTLYSSVVKEFVYTSFEKDKGLCRYDESGNTYTEKEFDSILPLFFIRQLITDERFPSQIGETAIVPKEAQLHNFMFRSIPSHLDKPDPGLYYLLESRSGRVDLEMPTDLFRITDEQIEFIDANSNRIDYDKSNLFTKLMLKKGFKFPATMIVGDPNVRKDYDEGYLIKDKEGKLFHFKMVVGRPYVKPIVLPEGIDVKHAFITEFRDKRTLGFIASASGKLYAIMNGSFEIRELDIPSFDPYKEVITIFGNMLDWTVQITSEEEETYYALDFETLRCIRTFSHDKQSQGFFEKWHAVLMPLRLTFTSQYDKWIRPRINE